MRNLITELRNLSSGTFAKNTFYVYLAQVASGGVGFALNLILIRHLNVQDYGLFSLYTSAAMLLAGLIHLGWLDAYNRFGSKYAQEPAFESVRKFFIKKMSFSLFWTTGVILLLSSWICRNFYQRQGFENYFRLAIVNGTVLCFWSFLNLDFQVQQKFKDYFYAQIFLNSARLIGIAGLFILASLSLFTAVSVNLLFPLFFLLIYSWNKGFFSKRFRNQTQLSPEISKQASQFRSWVLVSTVCNTLIGNIDLSILAHYRPNEALAQYGVASRMILPLHMAMVSLGMVMLPKFSSNTDLDATRTQLKKLILYLLPAAFLIFILCFFLPPVLARWAGGQYANSQELIRLFLFSSVIVFVTNPPSVFLTAWGHSRMLAALNAVQLVVDLILDLRWIPERGAIGAIQATIVVYLIGTAFAYFQVYRALRGKLRPL